MEVKFVNREVGQSRGRGSIGGPKKKPGVQSFPHQKVSDPFLEQEGYVVYKTPGIKPYIRAI